MPDSDSGWSTCGEGLVQVEACGAGRSVPARSTATAGTATMPRGWRGVTPKANADRDVGEWNAFEITMKGDRLTVVLNGITVIENAQLPGVPARGRIALQHHGAKKNGAWTGPPGARPVPQHLHQGAEVEATSGNRPGGGRSLRADLRHPVHLRLQGVQRRPAGGRGHLRPGFLDALVGLGHEGLRHLAVGRVADDLVHRQRPPGAGSPRRARSSRSPSCAGPRSRRAPGPGGPRPGRVLSSSALPS